MFVTFEGGEGTGKSTQIARVAGWLVGRGAEVVATREPGGTPLAEAVRAVLLDPGLAPDGLSEILLLAAARHDNVRRLIEPALARGAVVLADRFTDSSLVYQGIVRGLGLAEVERLNRLATSGIEPDRTLVLDLPVEEALARARIRGAAGESRLDDEPIAFHRRVREGFLELARRDPGRVRVVDAVGTEDAVFRRVVAALEDLAP